MTIHVLRRRNFTITNTTIQLTTRRATSTRDTGGTTRTLNVRYVILGTRTLTKRSTSILNRNNAPLFTTLLATTSGLKVRCITAARHTQIRANTSNIRAIYPPTNANDSSDAVLTTLPRRALTQLVLPLNSFTPRSITRVTRSFGIWPCISGNLHYALTVFDKGVVFVLRFQGVYKFSKVLFLRTEPLQRATSTIFTSYKGDHATTRVRSTIQAPFP